MRVAQLILVLGVCSFAVSCGGASATGASGDTVAAPAVQRDVWEGDLAGALPASTDLVVRVNGESARAWRGWNRIAPLIERELSNAGEESLETRVFRALFRDARELVVGLHVGDGAGHERGLGLATFTNARSVLGNVPQTESFGYPTVAQGGSTVALLDPTTVALLSTEFAGQDLQRIKSADFANVWTNEQMRSLRDNLHGEHATLTFLYAPDAAVREDAARDAGRELQLDSATAAALSSMRSISGRIDAADALQLSLFVDTDTEEHATLLATRAQALVRTYASNLAVQIAGLTPILNHIVINATGTRVSVQLSISGDETEALISRLLMIAG